METTKQDPKQDRYRIGCAGMFMLGMDYGVADEDEAIASCESGPMGTPSPASGVLTTRLLLVAVGWMMVAVLALLTYGPRYAT